MKIPNEVLEEWKKLYSHGDMAKIIKEGGMSRPTLSTAWKNGEASDEVFQAINEYYVAKKRNRFEMYSQILA